MNDELREDPAGAPTEYLCPACGSPLREVACPTGADLHGVSRALWCQGCGLRHPITHGVAALVPPDIEPDVASTIETFAQKWGHDVTAMRAERRRIANPWFLQRFGFGSGAGLAALVAKKLRVLDAGCGLGNLTELLAHVACNGTVVYGVDLSPAVFHVQRAHNVRLVQGDLTRLPIAGKFDLIVADGVLHHTADTRAALLALFGRLAPGGDLLCYIYKRKAPLREHADDYLRAQIGAMSDDEAMLVCEAIADLGRELRGVDKSIMIRKPIPALGIPAGVYPVQRFVYWFLLKCFYDDGSDGDLTTSMLENYDWYKPKYAWRHTREEIDSWLRELPLEQAKINEVEAGYAVHITKEKSCRS